MKRLSILPTSSLVTSLLLAGLLAGCGALSQSDPPALADGGALQNELRQLSAPAEERAGGRAGERLVWLRAFYQRRHGQPAWTLGEHGVHARADELLTAIGGAAAHGLDPETYGHSSLIQAINRRRARSPDAESSAKHAARLDVGLSAAFLAYADDLRRGAVDPAEISISWQVRRSATDLSGLLATAIALNRVGVNLARLAPTGVEYRRLQQALAGGSHGPGEADRLRANLERWRWLPRDLGSRYLLVRIADFELDYVVDGRTQTHRVIVGKPYRQTPQFASEVTQVVVHPKWFVPASIAEEELAPSLGAEAGARRLAQQGFQARTHRGKLVALDSLSWDSAAGFSSKYRLEQRAGGSNPLGRVKLDLLNPFAIFLHDTPGTHMFSSEARDLSHGCVRVEGIVDLVRELLGPSQVVSRFNHLLSSGKAGRVTLASPVPVYIVYWTVSVTPDGQLRSTEDLYDVDGHLLRALAQARHLQISL